MTALLTPEQTGGNKLIDAEQMHWIVERAFNADPSNVSARDCRKLLFHVEAIASKIERLCKSRGWVHTEDIRALVTAIRGEK